jgi:hypothetical protein
MKGGHGHVRPNPNGILARCGGPGLCPVCATEELKVYEAWKESAEREWRDESEFEAGDPDNPKPRTVAEMIALRRKHFPEMCIER